MATQWYAEHSLAPAEVRGSISPHQWVRMLVPDTEMDEMGIHIATPVTEMDEMEEFYEDEMEEMDEDEFDEME